MAQAIFILLTLWAGSYAWRNFAKIRQNILLGRDEDLTDNPSVRWRNMLLIAFGQKKMFANWTPAVLHLFIYVAFLFTQVELIEILIDGIFGVHRFFAPYLGGLYTFIISTIEVLSSLAFIATIAFLTRRNILKISRFQKKELDGFPRFDANMILILEIFLIVGIFSMNSADQVLQTLEPEHYHQTGKFPISHFIATTFLANWDAHFLVGLERFGWWLHYLVVLGFLNYLPFSKHLHVILAFPNTYFSRLNSRGEIKNMPEIMHEVRNMLGIANEGDTPSVSAEEVTAFGANDVFSLSWKNIMDAYSCTECGRCTAVCPANLTGKALSPRKIMMDVRDRAEEVGNKLATNDLRLIAADKRDENVLLNPSNFDDGKSLFDYIAPEEIRACTTCNACVEACPVTINPLDIILQLRRYEILTLSQGPADWTPMFTSLENGGSPWQMSDEREKWAKELI